MVWKHFDSRKVDVKFIKVVDNVPHDLADVEENYLFILDIFNSYIYYIKHLWPILSDQKSLWAGILLGT